MFHRLWDNRLYIKKEKCEFSHKKITFIGHKISAGLIRMDEDKVQVIKEWSEPSKMKKLHSFLELANYYRRFIKGYSKLVARLTDLLKKDQKWEWRSKCQAAFDELKGEMSTKPVLQLPNL